MSSFEVEIEKSIDKKKPYYTVIVRVGRVMTMKSFPTEDEARANVESLVDRTNALDDKFPV